MFGADGNRVWPGRHEGSIPDGTLIKLQKRLESAEKRLSRELPMKKSGDKSSSSEPSSEKDEARAWKPRSVKGEESEKENGCFIDDWDPFGDEAEL